MRLKLYVRGIVEKNGLETRHDCTWAEARPSRHREAAKNDIRAAKLSRYVPVSWKDERDKIARVYIVRTCAHSQLYISQDELLVARHHLKVTVPGHAFRYQNEEFTECR